jgi:hypothetical protein
MIGAYLTFRLNAHTDARRKGRTFNAGRVLVLTNPPAVGASIAAWQNVLNLSSRQGPSLYALAPRLHVPASLTCRVSAHTGRRADCLKLSVGVTSHPYLLEIEGLFTQGSRPRRTVGESVGWISEMDSSHWSNRIRYHFLDTRSDTEFNIGGEVVVKTPPPALCPAWLSVKSEPDFLPYSRAAVLPHTSQ